MAVLKEGSQGTEVKVLQSYLGLTPDGFFGAATHKSVVAMQKDWNLTADGIVGDETWAIVHSKNTWLRNNKSLLSTSLAFSTSKGSTAVLNSIANYGLLVDSIASALQIQPASAHAVIAVESAGSGMENNRMKIRFETHIFWRRWGKKHPDQFNKLWSFDSKEPWKEQTYQGKSFHGNQNLEYKAFEHAKELNAEAAFESISMGAGQLMGFHWKTLGFDGPDTFYQNQADSERNQIIVIFDFIKSNPTMLKALQTEAWYTFAYNYNGSGQPEKYSKWLLQRCNTAKTILDAIQ